MITNTIPPTDYLFPDQKRKLKLVQRIKNNIAKFQLKPEDSALYLLNNQHKNLALVRMVRLCNEQKNIPSPLTKNLLMTQEYQDLIKQAYAAFNARDIDAVLKIMHPEVNWSNGWEGGYVKGPDEVRKYWTRQWKELDPNVEPVAFKEKQDGQIEVEVHQIAKDLQGNVLFDGMVKHVYTIGNGLIKNMEIEK